MIIFRERRTLLEEVHVGCFLHNSCNNDDFTVQLVKHVFSVSSVLIHERYVRTDL